MKSKKYSKLALKTDLEKPNGYNNLRDWYLGASTLRLMHAAIGMCGETGEIADLIKKQFMYDKATHPEKLKEECGDVLWYMAIMLDEIGSSFEEVMEMNIDKLKKRYPDGFTKEAAIKRADKEK